MEISFQEAPRVDAAGFASGSLLGQPMQIQHQKKNFSAFRPVKSRDPTKIARSIL